MTLFRPRLALPFILFALWLGMLLLGGPRSHADAQVAHAFHFPALVPPARVVTLLGNSPVLIVLTLVAAIVLLLVKRSPRPPLIFLAIAFSGRVLVAVQKMEFARARPELSGRLVHVSSLSFPSGHAANSMIAWLAFALILAPPGRRAVAAAAGIAVAMLVGLSRLVLHVHWGSDVFGGWAFGAGWVLLCLRLAAGTGRRAPH